jgi:CheY-like chemotaxis protein
MRRMQVVRVETYELTSFSGGDVVRRLRARGTALPPIILISAHPDLPVIARLHMVNGYLQKRITLIQFLTMGAPFL